MYRAWWWLFRSVFILPHFLWQHEVAASLPSRTCFSACVSATARISIEFVEEFPINPMDVSCSMVVEDRTSVVSGKRVALGGRRIIEKKDMCQCLCLCYF